LASAADTTRHLEEVKFHTSCVFNVKIIAVNVGDNDARFDVYGAAVIMAYLLQQPT